MEINTYRSTFTLPASYKSNVPGPELSLPPESGNYQVILINGSIGVAHWDADWGTIGWDTIGPISQSFGLGELVLGWKPLGT